MANRTKKKCLEHRCDDRPFSGGFCRKHHELRMEREKARSEALTALHHATIDGSLLTSHDLRQRLMDIRKWWFRACDAINYERIDPVLKDEAEYASEWCIALAKEIVAAERAFRSGKQPNHMLEHTAGWVYERFGNLEKGLMSNGVARPNR